jgi:hypothetical protein
MVAGRDLCPETGYVQRGVPSFSYSGKFQDKCKGKGHPRTGYEDPEGE